MTEQTKSERAGEPTKVKNLLLDGRSVGVRECHGGSWEAKTADGTIVVNEPTEQRALTHIRVMIEDPRRADVFASEAGTTTWHNPWDRSFGGRAGERVVDGIRSRHEALSALATPGASVVLGRHQCEVHVGGRRFSGTASSCEDGTIGDASYRFVPSAPPEFWAELREEAKMYRVVGAVICAPRVRGIVWDVFFQHGALRGVLLRAVEECPRCRGRGRELDPSDHSSEECGRCDGYGVLAPEEEAPVRRWARHWNAVAAMGEVEVRQGAPADGPTVASAPCAQADDQRALLRLLGKAQDGVVYVGVASPVPGSTGLHRFVPEKTQEASLVEATYDAVRRCGVVGAMVSRTLRCVVWDLVVGQNDTQVVLRAVGECTNCRGRGVFVDAQEQSTEDCSHCGGHGVVVPGEEAPLLRLAQTKCKAPASGDAVAAEQAGIAVAALPGVEAPSCGRHSGQRPRYLFVDLTAVYWHGEHPQAPCGGVFEVDDARFVELPDGCGHVLSDLDDVREAAGVEGLRSVPVGFFRVDREGKEYDSTPAELAAKLTDQQVAMLGFADVGNAFVRDEHMPSVVNVVYHTPLGELVLQDVLEVTLDDGDRSRGRCVAWWTLTERGKETLAAVGRERVDVARSAWPDDSAFCRAAKGEVHVEESSAREHRQLLRHVDYALTDLDGDDDGEAEKFDQIPRRIRELDESVREVLGAPSNLVPACGAVWTLIDRYRLAWRMLRQDQRDFVLGDNAASVEDVGATQSDPVEKRVQSVAEVKVGGSSDSTPTWSEEYDRDVLVLVHQCCSAPTHIPNYPEFVVAVLAAAPAHSAVGKAKIHLVEALTTMLCKRWQEYKPDLEGLEVRLSPLFRTGLIPLGDVALPVTEWAYDAAKKDWSAWRDENARALVLAILVDWLPGAAMSSTEATDGRIQQAVVAALLGRGDVKLSDLLPTARAVLLGAERVACYVVAKLAGLRPRLDVGGLDTQATVVALSPPPSLGDAVAPYDGVPPAL